MFLLVSDSVVINHVTRRLRSIVQIIHENGILQVSMAALHAIGAVGVCLQLSLQKGPFLASQGMLSLPSRPLLTKQERWRKQR